MPAPRVVISVDAGSLTVLDEAALDRFARLLLAARRAGAAIEVRDARPALLDLLALVGFTDELLLQPHGQAEQREEVGVDEEVDAGDLPA
jgi:anti-anti-sigma regulatory factor